MTYQVMKKTSIRMQNDTLIVFWRYLQQKLYKTRFIIYKPGRLIAPRIKGQMYPRPQLPELDAIFHSPLSSLYMEEFDRKLLNVIRLKQSSSHNDIHDT